VHSHQVAHSTTNKRVQIGAPYLATTCVILVRINHLLIWAPRRQARVTSITVMIINQQLISTANTLTTWKLLRWRNTPSSLLFQAVVLLRWTRMAAKMSSSLSSSTTTLHLSTLLMASIWILRCILFIFMQMDLSVVLSELCLTVKQPVSGAVKSLMKLLTIS